MPSHALADRIEKQLGRRPLFLKADMRDIEALRGCRRRAAKRMATVTVLINNAALDDRHAIEEVTVEFWDNNQSINLRPHFFTAQAVAPGMRRQGHGSIINFTSTSFLINHPDMPSYTAAKAGIVGLTKGLAGKLGRDGIRVNAVAPGWVITERQQELWVTEEALAAHVAKQCIQRGHAARRHGRPVPVPGLGRLAHADRPDDDRRRRLPVTEPRRFAAVDWGTSSFRLWLLDASGAVLAEQRSGEGMLALPARRFRRSAGAASRARWGRSADLPVIVCGMAGARQGWIEAPYVATAGQPRRISCRRGSPSRARARDIRIMPGLAQREPEAPDVMRGEETQLAGIASCLRRGITRLHARHPFEMGRGRRRRDRRLPHLAHRRAVLDLVEAVDPAPCARRDSLRRSRPTIRCSERLARRRAGASADALSRLFRIRAATLLLEMKPRRCGGRAVRPADRRRDRLGARRASATGRQGRSSSRRARSALSMRGARAAAGYSPRRDADEAVRDGLLKRPRSVSRWVPEGPPHERAVPETRGVASSRSCAASGPTRRLAIGRAVFEAGIEAIEVPLNSPDPFTSIEASSPSLPASALVGAGTVLSVGDVDDSIRPAAACWSAPISTAPSCERAAEFSHGHHARRVHADRGLPGAPRSARRR